MSVAYISIGSNIEPEKHIAQALRMLASMVRVTAISTFYRTAALGRPDSPSFYNGVVGIETSLAPRELKFGLLREIERSLGRTRGPDRYAARTIDLDIAVYEDAVINETDLVVPDPDVRTRPFVAVPLLQIAPDLVLPDTGVALSDVVSAKRMECADPLYEFASALRKEISDEQTES